MSLPAVAGHTIYASDLYQLCQPSGGQEKGKYFINVPSYTSGSVIAQYMSSTSRNATPVSVTIDTADIAPLACGSPSTTRLTASGFQVLAISNAVNTGPGCAGNTTIQY